jgi:hypothetical protein
MKKSVVLYVNLWRRGFERLLWQLLKTLLFTQKAFTMPYFSKTEIIEIWFLEFLLCYFIFEKFFSIVVFCGV